MGEDLAFFLLASSSLLAIVDPIAAVPIYLSLTADFDNAKRDRVLRKAAITAIVVLIIFTLVGAWILKFFGITTTAFRIAGGIIFIGIGLDMLQARRSRARTTEAEEADVLEKHREDIGIVPLGMPTIAGPGAITTVMTLNAQTSGSMLRMMFILAAIVIVTLITWLSLKLAPRLLNRFGQTGLNVMTRIMGLLVMVVGVQFLIEGVKGVAAEIVK